MFVCFCRDRTEQGEPEPPLAHPGEQHSQPLVPLPLEGEEEEEEDVTSTAPHLGHKAGQW